LDARKITIVIIIFSIMTCFDNISFSATAIENNCNYNTFDEILKKIELTSDEIKIKQKWKCFLIESTLFTEDQHQKAIHNLWKTFNQSFVDLNHCEAYLEREQKHYSSSWIEDFRKRFDAEYINKNIKTIAFVIFANHVIDDSKLCREQKMKALYNDFNYSESVKNYVQLFIDFSRTLDVKEIKQVRNQIIAAETYLGDFQYPMQLMLSLSRVKDELFLAAIKTREDLDQNLIDFFSSHSFFKKSYDPMKAIRDLEALVSTESAVLETN